MTPSDLLEQFKVFAEEKLNNLLLPIKKAPGEEPEYRSPEVFKMNLPNKSAQKEKAPYVVLQFLNGNDSQNPGEDMESVCNIRVVVCAYSEDLDEGPLNVLNMLVRLRSALLEDRILANRYQLQPPLEYLVYPDNPAPFFFGEMITVWKIPTVRRKISYG